MSDYSETFTKVDGNTIEAADFETEFQAIATASATKVNVGDDITGKSDSADSVNETGASTVMNMLVLDIDDWNMDTTNSVIVLHGLTVTKIRSVDVMIRGDGGVNVYPIYGFASPVEGYFRVNATQIVLTRVAGGIFDDPLFNATSYNRGWITIWYTD